MKNLSITDCLEAINKYWGQNRKSLDYKFINPIDVVFSANGYLTEENLNIALKAICSLIKQALKQENNFE